MNGGSVIEIFNFVGFENFFNSSNYMEKFIYTGMNKVTSIILSPYINEQRI